MKKYFLITHIDGSTQKMPIFSNVDTIGKPANHPLFIGHALMIAKNGYCIDEKAAQPVMIGAGFIKQVEVVFEAQDDNHLIIHP